MLLQSTTAEQINESSENVSEIQVLTSRAQDLAGSIGSWNDTYVILVALTVLLAAGLFIAQFVVIRKSNQLTVLQGNIATIKESATSAEQQRVAKELADARAREKEADARIAEAQKGSSEANARAIKAQESLALAEQHSAEANAKAEGFRLDIAKAKEGAARANETAERERLARLQLEARLADRVLTLDQQRKLTSASIPLKGKTVDVTVFGDTPEIVSFSGAVLNCLRQAGLLVNTSSPIGGGSYARGVLIGIKPGSPPAFTRFADVFITILQEAVGPGVRRWEFDKLVSGGSMAAVSQAIGADQLGSAPIRFFIGSK